MINKENIICISSIDWDFVWQGHQEIMSSFAAAGNRVLFIENTGIRAPGLRDLPRLHKRMIRWFKSVKGFRRERDNLFVYSPVLLPFPYSRLARGVNRLFLLSALKRWMRAAKFQDPIIWTFLPTGTAGDIINGIEHKLLIYYCIADFYKLVDNPKKVMESENSLIKQCDLIFAQGQMLKDRCAKFSDNVHIFPFGVKMEVFNNLKSGKTGPPEEMRGVKKPVIGYVGGVHRHMDFEVLKFMAMLHPKWSITLVGPVQTDISGIKSLKNVMLLGKKDFRDLPAYINSFDVCVIPYEISEYTATVFPTKLNEYHALGKPVVSTPLPEVLDFNNENGGLVYIGRTKEEFARRVEEALNNGVSARSEERIRSAEKNDWPARIGKMSDLMEKALETKGSFDIDWQRNLLGIYRAFRRKVLGLASVAALIYLLVFYTPIMWIIARPLEAPGTPVSADCIVVFAGGVGESGKAGQGYEERVRYASELYKKGYAGHMIFSSGYSYAFNEAVVMKALAVSLGVPEDAIVLEEKAKNNYENVVYASGILRDKGWDNILLVTSPYNALRSDLIFKRSAKDIKVTVTPIPDSIFYRRPDASSKSAGAHKKISAGQIKGILHEYLGILYYKLKGRI